MTAKGEGEAGQVWAALIAHGYRVLNLSPDAFWALTPRELMATLAPAAPRLTRAALHALMRLHPDEETDDGRD